MSSQRIKLYCLPGALLDGGEFDLLAVSNPETLEVCPLDYARLLKTAGRSFSVAGAAEMVAATLRDAEGPYALLGHSLGGMVAQHAVTAFGLQPSHLILVETTFGAASGSFASFATGLSRVAMRLMGWSRLRKAIVNGHGRQSTAAKDYLDSTLTPEPPEDYAAIISGALSWNGEPHLGEIRMPTLILIGEKNPWTHGQAHQMQRTIPHAALHHIIDGAHMCMLDNPESFNERVHRFLMLD